MRSRCLVSMCVVVALLAAVAFSPIAMARRVAGPSSAPQAQPATGERMTFTGKVTDAQGAPVAGAKATLHQMTYSVTAASPQIELLQEKSSGTDGAFTLTVATGADSYRVGYVIVRKEGLALNWAMWRMQGDQQLDFVLGQPKELGGDVVDEKGQPVSDAEISIAMGIIGRMEDQRYLSSWGASKLLSTKTDNRGRFVFPEMPAEATFEFLAQKSGRACVYTLDPKTYRGEKCQFSPGQSGIRIVLPPEATIQGIVVEKAGGKPVAGVKIMAQPEPRGSPWMNEPATSGADGVFRLGGLTAGTYLVQLQTPTEQTAQWIAEPVRATVKAGEARSDLKLELAKGGIIEVFVKDSAGKPVEKASATFRRAVGEQYFSGRTDENGLARIRVTAGQYSFSGAYKEGYARQVMEQQEQITVEEGETRRIESVLGEAPKVMGIVRDPAGNPLAGVSIELKPMGGLQKTTDAQGRFEVSWDPESWRPGGTTTILIARDDTRDLVEAVEIDEQTKNLDLTLKPGAVVTGTVVNEENKPLAGARIRFMVRASSWGSGLGRGDLAKTGPDGKFEAKAIPPDLQYIVTALADGYGKRDVPIDAGAITDNRFDAGQFKLTPATLSLSGMVVDVNDKPVAGAEISGYGEGQPDLYGIRTDEEGKFTIKNVCPGRIRLNANTRAPMYMSGNLETEGGATDVKVVISERPTGIRVMAARRPPSLTGKPLPSLDSTGVKPPADAEGKMLLVCLFDLGQRPSRNCVAQLAQRAEGLKQKGVTVLAIQAGTADKDAFDAWSAKQSTAVPIGRIDGDSEKIRISWGAQSLPWLILTDKKHVVSAAGFGLSELDKKIDEAGR